MCRTVLTALSSIFAIALAPPGVEARTWNVTVDGLGDAPTIQAGIDSCRAGDTVAVGPGTYFERLIIDKGALTLRSVGGATSTTVDAERLGRPLTLGINAAGVIIHGITLEGGASPTHGGGVSLEGGAVDIQQCIIQDNITGAFDVGEGGGIYVSSGVTNCRVTDSIIRRNSAGYSGGGIAALGFVTIRGCTITENECYVAGGGILIDEANVTSNLILNNRSSFGAGACFKQSSSGRLVGNTIVDNEGLSGNPAGIFIHGLAPVVRNNIVAWNSTGAGIACHSSAKNTEIRCNVTWANGDDTIACMMPDDGSFSADPLFCNRSEGSYSLFAESPCTAEAVPTCGLIGAFAAGCTTAVSLPATWTTMKRFYR